MASAKIEVHDRSWNDRNRTGKTRVYFSHDSESILEGFGNRAARPVTVYRTFLPQVAEALGCSGIKFRWARKAGCSCGCSPGFIAEESYGKDVWVTLSSDAPKTSGDPEQETTAANRVAQLVGQLASERSVQDQVYGNSIKPAAATTNGWTKPALYDAETEECGQLAANHGEEFDPIALGM